jgi:hypothetical protein
LKVVIDEPYTGGSQLRASAVLLVVLGGALMPGLAGCDSSAGAGSKSTPLAARIAVEPGVHPAKGPICIRLKVANTSKEPVLIATPYWPVKSLDSLEEPDLPDTRILVEARDSRGKILLNEAHPLLVTRGITQSDFILLAPGASTDTTFDLTRLPANISFPESGEYAVKVLLRFVGAEWLERQKKERSWIVAPSTIPWLVNQKSPLFSGAIASNPTKVRVCEPTKSSPCHPEVKPKKCYESP